MKFSRFEIKLLAACVLYAGVVLCAGCSIRAEVSSKDVQDITKDMTYFKDKHGLC